MLISLQQVYMCIINYHYIDGRSFFCTFFIHCEINIIIITLTHPQHKNNACAYYFIWLVHTRLPSVCTLFYVTSN